MILLRYKSSWGEGHCLLSTDEESEDALRKLKDGQEVAVEMKRARSGPEHRLFFALLKKALDNQQTEFGTTEELREALMVEAGYTRPMKRLNGEVFFVAKSMSYHNMPQAEFHKLFKAVVELICKYVMPGTDPDELVNEIKSEVQRPEHGALK